jgi:hypothetical protein
MSGRIFNVLIGTWLFLSRFAWPHRPVLGAVTMIAGVLIVLSALGGIYSMRFRYVTAGTALVLFVASLASARVSDMTVWHNVVIAVVVFFVALVDHGTRAATDRGDQLSRPIGDYETTRTRAESSRA